MDPRSRGASGLCPAGVVPSTGAPSPGDENVPVPVVGRDNWDPPCVASSSAFPTEAVPVVMGPRISGPPLKGLPRPLLLEEGPVNPGADTRGKVFPPIVDPISVTAGFKVELPSPVPSSIGPT